MIHEHTSLPRWIGFSRRALHFTEKMGEVSCDSAEPTYNGSIFSAIACPEGSNLHRGSPQLEDFSRTTGCYQLHQGKQLTSAVAGVGYSRP
jgi:hypothetical protein